MIKVYHEKATESFQNITVSEPADRVRVAARRIVRAMQQDGMLPPRISDTRFSNIAEWLHAAMVAALEDNA